VLTSADHHAHLAEGTIVSIGSSSIGITDRSGTAWTVDLSASTKIIEAGRPVALGSLVAGEKVKVGGTFTTDPDVVDASLVSVVLSRIDGTVTSIADGSFDLTGPAGVLKTVDDSSTTLFSFGPRPLDGQATAASVTVGSRVVVCGVASADGTTLDATSVKIALDSTSGTIASVSGLTFVVSGDGAPVTVTDTASTIIRGSDGATSAAAIVVGARVDAVGPSTAPDALDGLAVDILPVSSYHSDSGAGRSGSGHHHHSHRQSNS
jgi:hypothetical protein